MVGPWLFVGHTPRESAPRPGAQSDAPLAPNYRLAGRARNPWRRLSRIRRMMAGCRSSSFQSLGRRRRLPARRGTCGCHRLPGLHRRSRARRRTSRRGRRSARLDGPPRRASALAAQSPRAGDGRPRRKADNGAGNRADGPQDDRARQRAKSGISGALLGDGRRGCRCRHRDDRAGENSFHDRALRQTAEISVPPIAAARWRDRAAESRVRIRRARPALRARCGWPPSRRRPRSGRCRGVAKRPDIC